MTSYKAVAKQSNIQLAQAQILQNQAELIALKHKLRADDMQSLAMELLDLLQLIINATDVRQAAGVYFLLNKSGKVLYVGKSENVLFRMAGHKEKDFHNVRMIPVPRSSERDHLEQRLIHLLKPPINVALTGYNNVQELLHSQLD